MRLVVVGNGIAGMEAARAARAVDAGLEIVLVSEESEHLFSRTALMYVLVGQLSFEATEPLERDAYARLGFRRVRDRVRAVDLDAGHLELERSGPLPFDRLVLAPGSRARPAPWPGAELPGVGSFVTLHDLAWLEAELDLPGHQVPLPSPSADSDSPYRIRATGRGARGRRPEQPWVVGGGLIGIEVVESLLALGARPSFVLREGSFWPIALDADESRFVLDRLEEHGVRVYRGHHVEALEGDRAVERIRTSGGTFEADLVVVAIGVVPNTTPFAGLPTDRSGALVVDACLRAAPRVWACGDAAAVPQPGGGHRTEPLWYAARAQGRIAGANAATDGVRPYVRGPWYNSAKLMDVEYTAAGDPGTEGIERWFFEERGRVRSTTRIMHERGRVVGFSFLGRRWDHSVCTRWIDERRPLGWVIEHLGDAAFDTELVPPLRVPAAARP